MVKYLETLAAIVAIHAQTSVPSKRIPLPPTTPLRDYTEAQPQGDVQEAVTAREAVMAHTGHPGTDYNGVNPPDVHITAPQLADIVGYSTATARRRLEYFAEQGVVDWNAEGNSKYWFLTDEFSGLGDETIRSEQEITKATTKLLNLAEDR